MRCVWLMLIWSFGCGRAQPSGREDAGLPWGEVAASGVDAGREDEDAGDLDAGRVDAGTTDAGGADAGVIVTDGGVRCEFATADQQPASTSALDGLVTSAWRSDCERFLACHPTAFPSVIACVDDSSRRRATTVVPETRTLADARPARGLDDRVRHGFVVVDADAGWRCLQAIDAGFTCPQSGSAELDAQQLAASASALRTCPGLLRGVRDLGHLCGQDEDCARGTCVRDVDAWYGELTSNPGTCRLPGAVGGRCGPAWPGNATCQPGLGCDGNGVCRPLAQVGATCVAGEPRVAGAYCTADLTGAGTHGTVVQLPVAGEPCPELLCDVGLRCVSGTCVALPGDGEVCLPAGEARCARGLTCVATTCVAFAAEHQPCGAAGCDTAAGFSCSRITRTCEHPRAVAEGQPCLPGDVCGGGTVCANAVEVAAGVGAWGLCKHLEPGDACTSVSGCLHLSVSGAPAVGRCVTASGVAPTTLAPGTCQLPSAGSACLLDSDCVADERCELRTCVSRLDVGARCGGARDCRPGLMCLRDAQGGSCQPLAPLGGACLASTTLANQSTCERGDCLGGLCETVGLLTRSPLAAGAPCSLGSECATGRCGACSGRCE